MSNLRKEVERSRAEAGDCGSPYYATDDGVITLRVESSSGEVWMLPWHHFIFGQYEAGDHERLVLTFVAHKVVLRGVNLGALIPEVADQHIASLRAASPKYLQAVESAPGIEDIQVQPLTEPVISS